MIEKPDIVVVDTNVLISGIIFPMSGIRRVMDDLFARKIVIGSDATKLELAQVLRRSRFERYLPLAARTDHLEALITSMRPIAVTERIQMCRDPAR